MSKEYFKISKELEIHHAVFYTLWNIGKPVFTETIPTAGVYFDREGDCLAFEFNPNFWKSINDYEKAFVISHECLHVILNHGYRIRDSKDKENANKALDIVVNHSLVNNFGFKRENLSFSGDLCWVDTIFSDNNIPNNESFEYYMKYLINKNSLKINKNLSTLDDHSKLGNSPTEAEEICKNLNQTLSEEEKNGLKETIDKHFQNPEQNSSKKIEDHKAGTVAGNIWTFAQVMEVKKKRKWETVIQKWAKQNIKLSFKNKEQWARTNRRFLFIADNLLLPTEMEIEEQNTEEDKIEVWFFQDTSGSCAGFRDRFFKAALSLPKDKFDIKMHCFDTQVYETTLKSKKLYGFGGTSFSILEKYVQESIQKENKKYPKAIFVITDGYGDKINPQYPRNWYWFLSTNSISCIPDVCNVFKLVDFE